MSKQSEPSQTCVDLEDKIERLEATVHGQRVRIAQLERLNGSNDSEEVLRYYQEKLEAGLPKDLALKVSRNQVLEDKRQAALAEAKSIRQPALAVTAQ